YSRRLCRGLVGEHAWTPVLVHVLRPTRHAHTAPICDRASGADDGAGVPVRDTATGDARHRFALGSSGTYGLSGHRGLDRVPIVALETQPPDRRHGATATVRRLALALCGRRGCRRVSHSARAAG